MAMPPKLPAERDRGLESRPIAARELLALGTMQFLQMAQSMALESAGLRINLPAIRPLHDVLVPEIFPAVVSILQLLYLIAGVAMRIRRWVPAGWDRPPVAAAVDHGPDRAQHVAVQRWAAGT